MIHSDTDLDIGFVYILCSKRKTAIYVGVTNSLKRRLYEHTQESKGHVGRYNIHYLVYFERIAGIANAIAREKQIKGWSRAKKNALIEGMNPNWDFLNGSILD